MAMKNNTKLVLSAFIFFGKIKRACYIVLCKAIKFIKIEQSNKNYSYREYFCCCILNAIKLNAFIVKQQIFNFKFTSFDFRRKKNSAEFLLLSFNCINILNIYPKYRSLLTTVEYVFFL